LIPDIKDISDVANVWGRRTVILKYDGSVWAWDKIAWDNWENGTFIDSPIPVR